MWALSWIADYPSPNDFLGILLGTDQPNNYGGWSKPRSTRRSRARSAPTTRRGAGRLRRGRADLRDEVPAVPVSMRRGTALAREGLLGAAPNGLGILRLAGLAWAGQ